MSVVNPKYIFDKKHIKDALEENIQQNGIDIRVEKGFTLQPKSFKNILCIESIFVPDNMMAIFHVRSSYSRKGVFLTSGVWDSGFQGRLGCSMYNMAGTSITIPDGERIGQVYFIYADSASLYNGQYQGIGLE